MIFYEEPKKAFMVDVISAYNIF